MRALAVLAAAVVAGSALAAVPALTADDPVPAQRVPAQPVKDATAGTAPGGSGAEPSVPTAGRRWAPPLTPFTVVRRFAVGPHRWSPGHRGVDVVAAVGQPILAPADGTVVFAGTVATTRVVVVAHGDGLRSTFQPAAATVPKGAFVRRGQPVATLAAEPGHCEPAHCVHWGVLRGSEYVDPLSLLGRRPVALLPLGAASGTGERGG